MWNSMRYVHAAAPSCAYTRLCMFRALRGKRNHPPRVENNARVRFLRPAHNQHATTIIFQWWRSKLRVYTLYMWRQHAVLAVIRCRVRMEGFELSPVWREFEDGWNGIRWNVRMNFGWRIGFCAIGFLFAPIVQFSFSVCIDRSV